MEFALLFLFGFLLGEISADILISLESKRKK